MSTMRVLIVDDEPVARRGLRRLVAKDPELVIVGESADGVAALADIRRHAPDLVLLDIQMPSMDGLEVLARLDPPAAPVIVFITAHDEFALRAFEAAAVDYLLKPFTDERFRAAIARAKRLHMDRTSAHEHRRLLDWIRERDGAGARPGGGEPTRALLQRLAVPVKGETLYLDVTEIDWLEAEGYCTRIHAGREQHVVRGHLALFERRLDPARFARIHRGCIVNLSRVRSLRRWFRGDAMLVLRTGEELRVSRTHRARIEAAIESTT